MSPARSPARSSADEVRRVGADEMAGALEAVEQVVAAAAAEDDRLPVDETVRLKLAQGRLDSAELYVAGRGFALLYNGALDLVVHPTERRRGRGNALLDTVLAAHPRSSLRAWSHGDHAAARRLAEGHHFYAARRLWLMRREAGPVAQAALPLNVRIRTFVPGVDDGALLDVNAAAFAAHPEQGRLSAGDLSDRMAQPWFDPAGIFIAERGTEVLGFHWTKVVDPHGPSGGPSGGPGEVYVVGIAPQAQGLGLGRALVTRGLDHLQPRPVQLFVEADNAPAIALYESLGFAHIGTDVQYARTLPS